MKNKIITLMTLAFMAVLFPVKLYAGVITMTVGLEVGNNIQLIFKTAEAKAMTLEGADLVDEQIQGDYCIRDYTLTSMDVKITGTITYFCCNDNNLSALDVTQCPELATLHCHNNDLEALDVTNCPELKVLRCSGNAMLGKLDLKNCTKLIQLGCSFSGLEALDVSNCVDLEILHCYGNILHDLAITNCKKLQKMNCSVNWLKELNVSECKDLTVLNCNDNDLTSIDVSMCESLQDLRCGGNQLTKLDVSSCIGLVKLECYTNQIKGDNMDKLIASLAEREVEDKGMLYIYHNTEDFPEYNVCTTLQVAEAVKRGWDVLGWTGDSWAPYEGSDPTGIEEMTRAEDADFTDVYDVLGRRQSALTRGLNIVKMSNGATVKIMK
ncbi:MAG: hypothetical protein SPI30_02290 [Prevotella sp.]|nr:hypothetical protein [Prevotella sp.]